MRTIILSSLAAATLLSSLVVAEAMPAPRIVSQDEATVVTPVRDGCGWRRHWSVRLRRCVWNG